MHVSFAADNYSTGSSEGFVVVPDFDRFEKIKDKEFRESRVVGGLWWALDEKRLTNVGGEEARRRTPGCGGT